MIWRMERVSSEDPILKKILTDENHLENFQDRVFEIYNIDKQSGGRSWGMTHTITSWTDRNMLKDDNGNALNLAIHINGEQLIWHPYIEYLLIKKIIEETDKIEKFSMGYIDGRSGHFVPFSTRGHLAASQSPGYVFWTEVN